MDTVLAPVAAEPPYRIHHYPSALIERIALADGRTVLVRPVLPQDADAEQAFFLGLSPASRRRRFHGVVNHLADPVLQAMTSVDYRQHLALVAEARCSDGARAPVRLVADARYVVDDDGSAEFAIAVADDWQGIGLGRAMLEQLAQQARASGLPRLAGTVLADNAPMLALMRRLGARLRDDWHDASIVHAEFVYRP